MRILIEFLAGLAIATNAVVYGTDVFGAIVLRPAVAAVADRVPDDARQLQARWASVIVGRVALQTIALVALCVGFAAA
jgi:hypothetical protein